MCSSPMASFTLSIPSCCRRSRKATNSTEHRDWCSVSSLSNETKLSTDHHVACHLRNGVLATLSPAIHIIIKEILEIHWCKFLSGNEARRERIFRLYPGKNRGILTGFITPRIALPDVWPWKKAWHRALNRWRSTVNPIR